MLRTSVRRVIAVVCMMGILLVARAARADVDVELLERTARAARAAGAYGHAIAALRQLRQVASDPEQLFAIGEAHHQRFLLNGEDFDLDQARVHYDRYVRSRPTGARLQQAKNALDELRDKPTDDAAIAAGAKRDATTAWLALMSSVIGTTVEIAGRRRSLPLFITLAPKTHVLKFRAPDHASTKRKVTVARGRLVAMEIDLEPVPAKLDVVGPDGALLYLDDQFVGALPLEAPLSVQPGSHRVRVSDTGYHLADRTVELSRGKTKKLEFDLDVTGQRIGAAFLLGGGAAGLAAGIVMGVLAVVEQRAAADFASLRPDPRSEADQATYLDHIANKEDFRVVSAVAGGFGLGLFLVGGALFLLDDPVLPEPVIGPTSIGLRYGGRF